MKLSEYRQKLNQNLEYLEAERELQLHFALANAILKARLEKGLSQSQLADALGTKQANISRIEAGLGNPTLSMIQKLANTLDLEITFSGKPPNQSTNEDMAIKVHQSQPVLPIQP